MAVDVFAALQPGLAGYLPLVLEVHGSAVAAARAMRNGRKLRDFMFGFGLCGTRQMVREIETDRQERMFWIT